MSLEIRPMTTDEVEEATFIGTYAFNSPERRNLAEAVERNTKFYPTDWSLASFEDGEMTAWLRMLPFAMRINGHGLSFAGIGPVVSLPQHRRKGHVGALLRESLSVMRDRGQVLSGLHTPHPTLYQRYGWEIASEKRIYTFPPKETTLKSEPGERGKARMLKPEEWAQADRIYRQHAGPRNGAIHRGELWWREGILSTSAPNPADIALWENGQGEPQGYVIYGQPTQPDEHMPKFWVRELVALTTDAYLNLILYLLRHDLPKEITWYAPVDDPFLSLVDDARYVKVEHEYDLLNRICDVQAALSQRPQVETDRTLALTLQVGDSAAPWNDGRWRVEAANGDVNVERTDGEPDLTLSATTLAPLFNGYLSPTAAAFAGRVQARNENVLATADAFFATSYPPYCADGF